jgi:hypothetical protein
MRRLLLCGIQQRGIFQRKFSKAAGIDLQSASVNSKPGRAAAADGGSAWTAGMPSSAKNTEAARAATTQRRDFMVESSEGKDDRLQ